MDRRAIQAWAQRFDRVAVHVSDLEVAVRANPQNLHPLALRDEIASFRNLRTEMLAMFDEVADSLARSARICHHDYEQMVTELNACGEEMQRRLALVTLSEGE